MIHPAPEARAGAAWLSRRALLRLGAGVGGVALIGRALPADAQVGQPAAASALVSAQQAVAAYVEITPDNRVRFTCPAMEIGQGVTTSLTQILAEEMEADWATIDVVLAGAADAYMNPMKRLQSVGQSMSIRGYYPYLREVGAGAREMLVTEAAARWSVDPQTCAARDSRVVHAATKRSFTFADLAEGAAKRTPPAEPKLKSPSEFRLIGRPMPRKDARTKIEGRATYGVDVQLPGMLHAAIAQAPVAGGKLLKYDRAAAEALPGVVAVVEVKAGLAPGLAVVADRWWRAKAALEAANAEFDAPEVNSDQLRASIREALAKPALSARNDGDAKTTLASAAKKVEAVYEAPFLAHACMEPMSAAAYVTDDACEVWCGAQSQSRARDDVAALLGRPKESVAIHTVYAGGGFGRRWQVDYALQAVEIAKAVGKPVKLIWSREQDMGHDFYRPAAAMRAAAALDSAGKLSALEVVLAGPSISEWGRPGRLKGAVDGTSVSGFKDTPYAIPNLSVSWVSTPTPVPVGTWRSVGHSQNGFFVEAFIDEVAVKAGADPVAFRRDLAKEHPRLTAVLDAVAKASDWTRKRPKGRGLGVALNEGYGSYAANVVEVSLKDGGVKIEKIWCAIDCGPPVNPHGVLTQAQSAVIYGLSAALWGDITIDGGATVESNFTDQRVLTLGETPPIEVIIIPAGGELGGAGEPALPGVAPALVNAIAAAGGPRIRTLPITKQGLEFIA